MLETDIESHQVAQTPGKKQRTHHQHNGKSHLRDDKNAPKTKTLAASGHSPASGLQQHSRLGPGGTYRGSQPEQNGGEYCERGRKRQDAPTHGEIEENLIVRSADVRRQDTAHSKRQKRSASRPGRCEQYAFRKQLANHAPA